jgi:hypothetical protein
MMFRLQRVEFIPKELDAGILYYAEEYGAAAHLCACGCGEKVRTPITPYAWSLRDTPNGPSLSPSIGNWQKPCRSHYWISEGSVQWSTDWSEEEVAAGRLREAANRNRHFADRQTGWRKHIRWAWNWLRARLGL